MALRADQLPLLRGGLLAALLEVVCFFPAALVVDRLPDVLALAGLAADAFVGDALALEDVVPDVFDFDRVAVRAFALDDRRRGAGFRPGTISLPFSTTVPAASATVPAALPAAPTAPEARSTTLPAMCPACLPTFLRIPLDLAITHASLASAQKGMQEADQQRSARLPERPVDCDASAGTATDRCQVQPSQRPE